jgi:PAP2 superfamily C-terminal
MAGFFEHVIAGKKGMALDDIILEHLPVLDCSWTIFAVIYSSILITLVRHFRNPMLILLGLATYSGVTWLRMLAIYTFTLEPPAHIIPLKDPFLSLLVYPQSDFSKDLFFSGHVSSMSVLVFVETDYRRKILKIIATVWVGLLLLLQHVHYTLDVVTAPVFTFGIYWLFSRLQKASEMLR